MQRHFLPTWCHYQPSKCQLKTICLNYQSIQGHPTFPHVTFWKVRLEILQDVLLRAVLFELFSLLKLKITSFWAYNLISIETDTATQSKTAMAKRKTIWAANIVYSSCTYWNCYFWLFGSSGVGSNRSVNVLPLAHNFFVE